MRHNESVDSHTVDQAADIMDYRTVCQGLSIAHVMYQE